MRRLLPKVLCILLVSLLLAGAVNLVRPNPVPWIQDWDGYVETKARDAGIRVVSWSFVKKQFEEQSALFVDARSVEEFEAGHIPDAISLPFKRLDDAFEILAELVESDKPLTVYCQNRDCDDGLLLAMELQALEQTNLFYFVDGFDAWEEAGCPTITP